MNVVSVKFSSDQKTKPDRTYDYFCLEEDVKVGDFVVVENDKYHVVEVAAVKKCNSKHFATKFIVSKLEDTRYKELDSYSKDFKTFLKLIDEIRSWSDDVIVMISKMYNIKTIAICELVECLYKIRDNETNIKKSIKNNKVVEDIK